MILSLVLTAAIVAAPPSPRAVREHQQTIDRRHARRAHDREAESYAQIFVVPLHHRQSTVTIYSTPFQYSPWSVYSPYQYSPWTGYSVYPYSPWDGFYPYGIGQLPPYWNAAYGGFMYQMGAATW